jgi:hypothetical protein
VQAGVEVEVEVAAGVEVAAEVEARDALRSAE